MDTTPSNVTNTTELGEDQCAPYVVIAMVAQLTMLIQLILLGITIYFNLTKLNPNLQIGEQKRNSGVRKKFKGIFCFPTTWCSSSSQVILIPNRHSSQDNQPSIKVDQTDAQLNDSPESQTSIAQNKEGSPMPPIPDIELPPTPSNVDEHSRCSFGCADEDHEYDYIALPINKNQQQHKPPKEQGRESKPSDNNVSERSYGTLEFMPPQAESKERKKFDNNAPKSLYDTLEFIPQAEGKKRKKSDNNAPKLLYDTLEFMPPQAEGKERKKSDNNAPKSLYIYDTLEFMPPQAEGKESKHFDNTASKNLYDISVDKSPKAEEKENKCSNNNESENLYDELVPISK
ncbi:uncharacterized protein LOC123518292 [Portunus trituberculatus]|uniref:uncharacterized protein LOC123518292 n=1 Tax=Portunus trituberculatus TaxID=210409 RepID=UPI001E1CBE18|nr:uncharacterized protein LOC123518292 [Portunus trituberculatus]